MRIKRLNDLRCGERLFKTFKYLQRGTGSTDLLKYIVLDKFSRSFFFSVSIEQQSPLAVYFFYTGIVEDRLIDVVSI